MLWERLSPLKAKAGLFRVDSRISTMAMCITSHIFLRTVFKKTMPLHPKTTLRQSANSLAPICKSSHLITVAIFAFVIIAINGCEVSRSPQDLHNAPDHENDLESDNLFSRVIFDHDFSQAILGVPTKLRFHIEDEKGVKIFDLVPLHEKLVHLILVREGLDHFDHIHPVVSSDGMMSVSVTFPKPGTYFVYADYQPINGSPSLAKTIIDIPGERSAAKLLEANASPDVVIGDLHTRVTMSAKKEESIIAFQIHDRDLNPVSDLQPYLGAMGHLVVISADGKEYVHAHPIGDNKKSESGQVAFAAHFLKAGIYKMWGQFQRQDEIVTVPFVIDYHSYNDDRTSSPSNAEHKH